MTTQAPQRLMSSGMPAFRISAQPEQRRAGCAKRVMHGSQTMPLLGQALHTAHWLGIRFNSLGNNCQVKGEKRLRNNGLNIDQQYTRMKYSNDKIYPCLANAPLQFHLLQLRTGSEPRPQHHHGYMKKSPAAWLRGCNGSICNPRRGRIGALCGVGSERRLLCLKNTRIQYVL